MADSLLWIEQFKDLKFDGFKIFLLADIEKKDGCVLRVSISDLGKLYVSSSFFSLNFQFLTVLRREGE